jgi:hypothetical protein
MHVEAITKPWLQMVLPLLPPGYSWAQKARTTTLLPIGK